MYKLLLILAVIILSINSYAQKNVVVLHPILGDSIDLAEKQIYLLFPDINDSDFNYGKILKGNGKYILHTFSATGDQEFEIDSLQLVHYQNNINKLIAYQNYMENPKKEDRKSLVITNQKDTCALEMNLEYMSPAMRKKLRKDSYRYQRLKSAAESLGYWGVDQENYIKTTGIIVFNSKGSDIEIR
ncbi:hypothetical protein [Ancylomarina longa]|uniref:Uncharacterized protein n=1 Tax=Ancylomarina longa TaxID=2487017 RepID=A0A434AY65_9BACT|nr:hypothetical protein [Ancylomarina longa]RUT79408.1 hypothetical protein DLK05_04095 [Ancylomarina longa]